VNKIGIFTKRVTKQQMMSVCKNKNFKKTIQTQHEELEKKIKQTNKNTEIYIYDITHNPQKPQNQETKTINHINKTGENPLIKQTKKNIFIDMTHPYIQKKGKTTTCLGRRYNKEKQKHTNPSTNICHYVIILKANGFNKIYGRLINVW